MTVKKLMLRSMLAILSTLSMAFGTGCSSEEPKTEVKRGIQVETAAPSEVQQAPSIPSKAPPAQTGQVADVKSESASKKTEKIKVTFLELGSVRCIPCKMMKPIMDAVEKDYAGQVKVVFHDVWTPEGRPAAEKYGIQAIPTQVFLDSNGKEYYRHAGFFPKDELIKILQQKGVK